MEKNIKNIGFWHTEVKNVKNKHKVRNNNNNNNFKKLK